MNRFLPGLLMIFGSCLWAQSRELWFSAGGSILSHTEKNARLGSPSPDGDPADVRLANGYRFGFRFAINSNRHMGHEIQYAYNRTRFTDNDGGILGEVGSRLMAIHQGGYNFLFYITDAQESKILPFVTAGFHVSDFPLPGSAAVQASSVKPGFNYGVGFKYRLSTLFLMRVDLREYETGKPNWNNLLFHQSGLLHQTEVSAGIGIIF